MTSSYPAITVQILFAKYRKRIVWRWRDLAAPFWRLYWNPTAGGSMVYGGKRMVMRTDRIYLVPPDTHFSAGTARPFDHFFMHFIITYPFSAAETTVYSIPVTSLSRALLRKTSRLVADDGNKMQISLAAAELITHCIQRIPNTQDAPVSDMRLARAIAYLSSRFQKPLSLVDLSKAAGVAVPTVHRLFKRHVGCTPHLYLMRLRMEHAAAMLRFTDATIDTIASSVGCTDRYHLTRLFARIKGIPPARFRRVRRELRRGR